MQDEFCTPLGLNRTRCDSNVDIIPNRAQGYGVVEGQVVNDGLFGVSNSGGAGMLMATARDLVVWQAALFGGEVVSFESLEQMITPALLAGGESTGYGFGLNPGGFEGRRTVGHSGGVSGFSAMLVSFPDDDLHIAVISNIEGGLRAQSMAQDIARLAFGIFESVLDLPLSAEDLTLFSGTYNLTRVNHDVTIYEQEGSLYIQPTGRSASRLLHQGGGEFRAEDDLDSKVVFDAEHGSQFVLHQSGLRMRALRVPRGG